MPTETAYEHGARKLTPRTGPDPNDDFSQDAAENKKPPHGIGLTRPMPDDPGKPKRTDAPRDTRDAPAPNPDAKR